MPTTKTFNGNAYVFPTDFLDFNVWDIWEQFWSDVGTALDATTSYADLDSLGTTPASADRIPIWDQNVSTYKYVRYDDLGIGGGAFDPTVAYGLAYGTSDHSALQTTPGFTYRDDDATVDHLVLDGTAMDNAPMTADYMYVNDDSLTDGGIANLYSNSPSTNSRNIVTIHQAHASASGSTPLSITQAANSRGLSITTSASNKTGGALNALCGSQTSGSSIRAQCSNAAFSGSVFNASVTNASSSGAGFEADMEGTGPAFKVTGTPATAILLHLDTSTWYDTNAAGSHYGRIPVLMDDGTTVKYLHLHN